jgi:hypothetical protein
LRADRAFGTAKSCFKITKDFTGKIQKYLLRQRLQGAPAKDK